MIRITDFSQRAHDNEDVDARVFEMIMGHGFRHDVTRSDLGRLKPEQVRALPEQIMNELTQSWNKHIYGEILEKMEVLRVAIIENAKAIDKSGEESIRTAYTEVMMLCQIQPPEEKPLIQVPGEKVIRRVN